MKTKAKNPSGEKKMKTSAFETTTTSDPAGFLQISMTDCRTSDDNRLQQLLDLAHDGDEIARAELELIWELA